MRSVAKAVFSSRVSTRLIGLAVLAAALAVKALDPGLLETLQLKTFDVFQKLNPRHGQAQPVVVVDLDEKSLAALGQWPWPRTIVADLVGKLMGLGAAAVATDIVFSEPDRLSPADYGERTPGLSEAVRAELAAKPSNDAVLADVLRRSRVVLGQSGLPMSDTVARRSGPATPVASIGGDPRAFLIGYPRLLRNIEVLDNAAIGRGLISVGSEADGIVRRVSLISVADGGVEPGLAIELLRVATGSDALVVKSNAAGVASVVVGGVAVPTDRNGRIWVNFGPHDGRRFVSAVDVVRGEIAPERMAGHLVLIGTSAVGLGDLRATPLTSTMPGVEIHAQLLETILSRTWLERPQYALGAEIALTVLVSTLIILVLPSLGALRSLMLGGAVAAAVAGGSWLLFSEHRLLLDPLFPMATSLAVFLAMAFENYRREESSKRSIRNAFARYLDPAMVERLAAHPERLSLGGETRELTVLFSDVRGFTAISESFSGDPQGLTRLMNRFLTPISLSITERRGTIDKYMGDAVMAFWNAPLDDEEHAENACAAALEMVTRLGALNAERAREDAVAGRPHLPLVIGIGINTGSCVVGNMGSDVRFDYSVLGDSVNIASRLEGQTKDYGVTILIGEETATRAARRFALVEADLIRVKGKSRPSRAFALVGGPDLVADARFTAASGALARIIECYRRRRWRETQELCAQFDAAHDFGLSGLVALYARRAAEYDDSPPPDDWDGVYQAKSK